MRMARPAKLISHTTQDEAYSRRGTIRASSRLCGLPTREAWPGEIQTILNSAPTTSICALPARPWMTSTHSTWLKGLELPELCRFNGIVITMYYGDHPRPHFHARHNEDNAEVSIEDLTIIEGSLSQRDWRLVHEGALARQSELREAWNRAERDEPPGRVAPLD